MKACRSRFAAAVAAGFAVGLLWQIHRADPVRQMALNSIWAHHFALLSWIWRSLFHDAGPLISLPIFHPTQGAFTASELPLLLGLVFGALREFCSSPFLAWHLTFALAALGNIAAMWVALRREGIGAPAALAGAVAYDQAYWLYEMLNAVAYRAAFGPPLAWYFLTRIREEGARSKLLAGLSTVLLAQLLSCQTNALSTLVLVGARVVWNSELRAKAVFPKLLLAHLPVWIAGAFWLYVSRPYLPIMGLGTWYDLLFKQLSFRVDLISFLPIPNKAALIHPHEAIPWIGLSGGALSGFPVALWPAFFLAGIALARIFREAPPAGKFDRPSRRDLILVGVVVLIGAALTQLAVAWKLHKTPFPLWMWSASYFFWLAVAAHEWWQWKRRGWVWRLDRQAREATAIIFFGWACALGPVIYAFGQPILVGALAALDVVVLGLARVRAPMRFFLLALPALSLLAARGLEGFRWWRNDKVQLAAGAALAFFLAGELWPAGRGLPYLQFALAPEACPTCNPGDLRPLPLPYEWLRTHAPGEALLELPAGGGTPFAPEKPAEHGHDAVYLFYQGLDGIARLNGFHSHFPFGYWDFVARTARFPEAEVLDEVRAHEGKWILVHGERYSAAEWARLQQALSPPPPGLSLVQRWGPVWLLRVE